MTAYDVIGITSQYRGNSDYEVTDMGKIDGRIYVPFFTLMNKELELVALNFVAELC